MLAVSAVVLSVIAPVTDSPNPAVTVTSPLVLVKADKDTSSVEL